MTAAKYAFLTEEETATAVHSLTGELVAMAQEKNFESLALALRKSRREARKLQEELKQRVSESFNVKTTKEPL
jgi:hypothetical protein